jgi:ATP-dependent Clp protease ATP-binding subunit ClpA
VDIVKKQIEEFRERLEEKKVKLDVTEAALEWLAGKGYSDEFGAREIGRLIQDKVKDFFVKEVLFGRLTDGGSVTVDVEADDIIINVASCAMS